MTNLGIYQTYLNRGRLIHIADADPAVSEALSILFRLEGYETSFSLDLGQCLAHVERRRPDAAIVNIQLGSESGLVVLRRLRGQRNAPIVVMLADRPQVEDAVTAMKMGATDVIGKPIDTDQLLAVVGDALRREVQIGGPHGGRRSIEGRGFDQLTPREREVLELITNGQSNKEAGRELGISPRTIEVHRARVMEKLGARNTADLMRIVLTS